MGAAIAAIAAMKGDSIGDGGIFDIQSAMIEF